MRIYFGLIFTLVFVRMAWATDAPVSQGASYEIQSKEYDAPDLSDASKKVKRHGAAIIFRDANGREIKRETFHPEIKTGNGKPRYMQINVLENKTRNHVVVLEQQENEEELNPYKMRASSGTHILWYTVDGLLKCDITARYTPKVLSEDGRSLVVTEIGFDPVEFERFHKVPGLRSTSQLKRDISLMSSHLHVLNEQCQIVYSTISLKSGWNIVLISPSGKWLLLEENETGVNASGEGRKFSLILVDLKKKQSFLLPWNRTLTPDAVDDLGTLMAWKNVGDSKKTHTVKFYGGIEKEVPYTKYIRCVRPLGENGFRETAEEKEE